MRKYTKPCLKGLGLLRLVTALVRLSGSDCPDNGDWRY